MRAASRAHGIFGRALGRVGDTAKARENLERAIELAEDSDENETVLAMLALGHHLENAEGDYAAYTEALALAQRIGDVPAQIELQAPLAQLAFYHCDWEEVGRLTTPAPSSPNARAWSASCACRDSVRGGRSAAIRHPGGE